MVFCVQLCTHPLPEGGRGGDRAGQHSIRINDQFHGPPHTYHHAEVARHKDPLGRGDSWGWSAAHGWLSQLRTSKPFSSPPGREAMDAIAQFMQHHAGCEQRMRAMLQLCHHSRISLPGLPAWVEVGGIASSLCLKSPLTQPILT